MHTPPVNVRVQSSSKEEEPRTPTTGFEHHSIRRKKKRTHAAQLNKHCRQHQRLHVTYITIPQLLLHNTHFPTTTVCATAASTWSPASTWSAGSLARPPATSNDLPDTTKKHPHFAGLLCTLGCELACLCHRSTLLGPRLVIQHVANQPQERERGHVCCTLLQRLEKPVLLFSKAGILKRGMPKTSEVACTHVSSCNTHMQRVSALWHIHDANAKRPE